MPLEPYVATLETCVFTAQDTFENLEVRMDDLEGKYADFTIAI